MNNSIYSEIFLRKSLPFIYKFMFIMFIILLIVVGIILNMNYRSVIRTKGIVQEIDNNYYVMISVKEDEVKYLVDNSYFEMNNNLVYYKIFKIDEELYTDNTSNYKIIYIKTKLDKEYKINNLNLDIKINKENKKIIRYIIDYLEKR